MAQSPEAGSYQPPGATISLSVSKGPTTSTVPDVTSLAQADALAQLRASGFKVHIVAQPELEETSRLSRWPPAMFKQWKLETLMRWKSASELSPAFRTVAKYAPFLHRASRSVLRASRS